MGGEELKGHQLAHNQLISLQVHHFSPQISAETNEILCSIQVSIHREPPEVSLVKKVNRKFELVGMTSALKLRPEKVMVDFKFDALYR